MEKIQAVVKGQVAEVPMQEGQLEVVVNSGKLDRQGEVLDINGLDLSNYMTSPVVAWGHNYSEPAIGKALSVWKDQTTGALKAVIQFAVNEYPFAKLIYDLYKGEYMRAFSIGFIPQEAETQTDGSTVYTKSEMLEFSAVLVGADPRALTMAKSMGGDNVEKVMSGEMHIKDYTMPVEKEGRVLSKSNRNKVESAVDALTALLDADSKAVKDDKPAEATEEKVVDKDEADQTVSEPSAVLPSKRYVRKVRILK